MAAPFGGVRFISDLQDPTSGKRWRADEPDIVLYPSFVELGRFPFDKLAKLHSLDQINPAAVDSRASRSSR